MNETDYATYRGKCKGLSEELCRSDASLRLVRGFYHCPVWGKQAHWWTVKTDGEILDPSVKQFPTNGVGATYEEYDDTVDCEYCGRNVHESDAYFVDYHVYCSDQHYARDIGF